MAAGESKGEPLIFRRVSADKMDNQGRWSMSIRSRLQHRLNPLHVYCRLRCLGVGHNPAKAMSYCYERMLYRLVLA